MKWSHVAGTFLLAVGLLQPIGYATGSMPIRGIGYLSAASPLPLVFTQFRGVETFGQSFSVSFVDDDGSSMAVALTPELYARLDGAYNRRNVYGGAFGYGAGLESADELAMLDGVVRYGFCAPGVLRERFGRDRMPTQVIVSATPRSGGATWRRKVDCR